MQTGDIRSEDHRGPWSDEQLVTGLRNGDERIAEIIVRTYGGRMLAVSRRILRDEALAEDCVQEAFLSAFRKIGEFEGRSSLKTWLHRIVVNQSLMKYRRQARLNETQIDPLLPEFDDNECRLEAPWLHLETPEEIFGREQARQHILQKIDELPDSYRIVIYLRDIEEMTTGEVADALHISEANVKVRLHRSRSALKKLLEPVLKGAMR